MICRIPISNSNLMIHYIDNSLDIESISDCLKDEPYVNIQLDSYESDNIGLDDVYSISIDDKYFYVETKIDLYDYLDENDHVKILIFGTTSIVNDKIYYDEITEIILSKGVYNI